MRRFSSLELHPAETRQILRDRFARYLPSDKTELAPPHKDVTLPDEAVLQFFLNLTIDFESDLEKARVTYVSLSQNSSAPSLEELMEDGWFHVVWGRISTPFEIAQAARRTLAGTMTAFVALLERRYEQVYRLTDSARSDTVLVNVATAIDRGELTPRDIGCQTPEWVAARLWDRTLTDPVDGSAALRVWMDRWRQLGCPSLVPGRVWNEAAASAFREAVFEVLESDPSLVGWDEKRTDFVRQIALTSQRNRSSVEDYVSPIPATLVDRALWLDDPSIGQVLMETMFEYEDFSYLVHLLVAEVKVEDHAPAPHTVASRLIALAIDRPDIFLTLRLQSSRNSVLLADLLLYPKTSALACLLIAQWQSPSSAWDRQLISRDNSTTKATAFADAISVLGYFLRQGTVDPEEVAALMNWFHKQEQVNFIGDLGNNESLLAALRGELARQSPDVLRAMLVALSTATPKLGLGTSTFAAAMDVVDVGQLASDIDPEPLVEAYVQSIAADDYTLSANRVSISGAVSLLRLADRTSAKLRQRFLSPVDIKARLAAADENSFTLAPSIARSIRAHICVLSRAVVGWAEAVPDNIADALIAAVHAGAVNHEEKGRIAVFSPRYETRESSDRPIAADIGAALYALDEEPKSRLLSAILETNEPMVLAQLLAHSPYVLRERIKHRIAELTPSEADDIHSLTEAQARIEALLSADLGDAAKRFMEAEHDLKTWGPVAGREMVRLQATLRLHLLREEWNAIVNTEPPSHFSHAQRQEAVETITFYQALAALKKPDGDRRGAEQIFVQLQRRHPDVTAYALNLFATRIGLLLDSSFEELHGPALVHGRQILAEAEEMMLRMPVVNDSDTEIFRCNKALLLLALGQSEQANELLTALPATRLRDTTAAYTAIALARLERRPEAMALLDQAKNVLGDTDVLREARAYIENGKPFAALPSISSAGDPVPRIKVAISDFRLMDPDQQAEVLRPGQDSFEALITDYVRSAAASVTALVPMMKDVVIDSCEDDLNALIRELLTEPLQFLGWSVSDQSKGGYTAKENPGERDLIVKKGSTRLAVIEAVVCKQYVDRQNLRRHFQKLFGYDTCTLFLHLTYAYVENSDSVLDKLRDIAEHDAPKGFIYLRRENIRYTDSRPAGFTAYYRGESGVVQVVFLVLDMRQNAQREAAKIAVKKPPVSGNPKSRR